MFSPWAKKPGAIHPLLFIPFFYILFSGFPFLGAILLGAFEIRAARDRRYPIITMLLSMMILIGVAWFIASRWDHIMSV